MNSNWLSVFYCSSSKKTKVILIIIFLSYRWLCVPFKRGDAAGIHFKWKRYLVPGCMGRYNHCAVELWTGNPQKHSQVLMNNIRSKFIQPPPVQTFMWSVASLRKCHGLGWLTHREDLWVMLHGGGIQMRQRVNCDRSVTGQPQRACLLGNHSL